MLSYSNVNQIEALSSKELKLLFEEIFESPPPVKSRREFLIGNIVWAIQANQNGNFKKQREKLIKSSTSKRIKTNTSYKEGTRLVREWDGITHEVKVVTNGFIWQQQEYKTLSEIARAITGTRWSGPRFFGLTS